MPTIHILGFSIEVGERYLAGQAMTEAEARFLNLSLSRGVAKGLHKVIAGAISSRGGAGALDEAQRGEVLDIAQNFISAHANGFSQGFEKVRAIEVEARRIALGALQAGLYRAGKQLSDISEGEREEKLGELILTPAIRREAETRVESATKIANMAHEELLASLGGQHV